MQLGDSDVTVTVVTASDDDPWWIEGGHLFFIWWTGFDYFTMEFGLIYLSQQQTTEKVDQDLVEIQRLLRTIFWLWNLFVQ